MLVSCLEDGGFFILRLPHGVISPEDGTLRCENLKPYKLSSVSFLKSTHFIGFYQLIFIKILQML
jgi:hypothetical protein